jgi:hypothetical protein
MDSKPTKIASDSLPATFFHMDFEVFFKTSLGSMVTAFTGQVQSSSTRYQAKNCYQSSKT